MLSFELSTEVTDALVLKHQVISKHSADKIVILLYILDQNITFIVNKIKK